MKILGPYVRKDKRSIIVIIKDDGTKTSKSYPKYLMEQYLGRDLTDEETVDHINRDVTDNRIENLQVLKRSEHVLLDAVRAKKIEIVCALCGEKALKSGNDLNHNAKRGKAGPFCSRHCSGIYGKRIQMGEKKFNRTLYKREYYQLDKYAPITELVQVEGLNPLG